MYFEIWFTDSTHYDRHLISAACESSIPEDKKLIEDRFLGVVSTHLFFVLLRTTLYTPLTLTQFDPFSSPCVDVFCIFLRVPSACVFKVQIMSSSVRKTFSWKAVLLLFLLFWAEQSAENISGSQLPPGEFVVSCPPLSAYSVVTQ